MLKSVILPNNNQLELTPLTILTGVNNSGKTTILKRIAALPNTEYVNTNREQLITPHNVQKSVNKWLNRMGLENLKGAGARHVFPILTAGTQLKPKQTLIIENPEIFLHPKNQMKLADFFISLVNKNRQVIIETHGDHIINRVLRRVLECETEFLLNATTVYFLEQSSIKEIEMDRVGGIREAPEDFFGQFADETGHIISAGLDNIKRGNK